MQQYSFGYTVGFAGAVCVVCAVLVSSSAVSLRERQEQNEILDRQHKVLDVAGLVPEGRYLSREEVAKAFAARISPRIVDLKTGQYISDVDTATFDQGAVAADPQTSRPAPPNGAQVKRIPDRALVYEVTKGDSVEAVILPVQGKGLWSTLYGYLALAPDAVTVKGLTFYQHGETPGLGGEVDNPSWKAKWVGRKAYDDNFAPALTVVKGQAGSPEQAPHKVDGLSGATLTSRGVTELLSFWLGENGFKPFLTKFRSNRG